jgi:predicted exporter
MTFPQRRKAGLLALCAFVVLSAAWLLRLDFSAKISTDVLDLIPADERDPELAIVRRLASETEARTMLFVLSGAEGSPAALEATREFVRTLGASGHFDQAIALADPGWRDAIGRELFAQRFALLFPTWLREREGPDLAVRVARELKAWLERPEAVAYQDLVPADPLLLLPDAMARLKHGLALVQPESGGAMHPGLVWAQLRASPLSEAGQQPVFAAIERALLETQRSYPEVRVAYTGVNRFAAASRASIEREVSWLNAASLIAVLAVAWLFLRGVHRVLHLVPVIACATLGAWVATTAAFDRVHVVVFVLGALLAGVAIDYGFYLYLQPAAEPEEDYGRKVRRLLKPLLASCATTVLGFALLLYSKLPMLRQLSVFVAAGLVCALGAAIAYFAILRRPYLETRAFRGAGALPPSWRKNLRAVLIAAWALALLGLMRVTWRDDIRELEVPTEAVKHEDARIRAIFGQQPGRHVFLTHGTTIDEARAALHHFERWVGDRGALANLAGVVPTPRARETAAEFIRSQPAFPQKLRAALEAEGFSADAFSPFFEAYARYADIGGTVDLTAAMSRLRRAIQGPLGLLLHVGVDKVWFVTLASGVPEGAPPAEAQTVAVSQLQSLNRLFSNYRSTAVQLSLGGLAIVGLGVLGMYGLRDGLRIFAIPCGSCLGIFGALGWLGQPLNLFHLLGAFLGVCLTHNYSIFSATSAYRAEPPPVSVRLSALTTAASFGVLAFSSIPVVHALGVTVAAMVLLALAVLELEHLSGLRKKA